MISLVFTIDYEIYGDGSGRLTDLVYEPARRLVEQFRKWDARFVAFVEAAEFEKIEAFATDPAIDQVRKQIAEFHRDGFEVALHLHPQWCNARFEGAAWSLDYREYNLCRLERPRITEIVGQSIDYLRHAVGDSGFAPLSFRAGNWLFQPTATIASVLAEHGIKVDSSVFKGGLQHLHQLDYRPAMRNGYYWPFESDANVLDATGRWIEVPIYTDMVPFWRMATAKRLSMKAGTSAKSRRQSVSERWSRISDRLRYHYPLKLDFCRMTLSELTSMMDGIIGADEKDPETFRPVVAIGHTKDLTDFETVEAFLAFLRARRIPISTFSDIYPTLAKSLASAVPHATMEASEARSRDTAGLPV
jgi:hypothetical protein